MSQQREIFEALRETHGHVIGGSGSGKSKFLEWLMRWRTANGGAFGLIDWHGTLYNDILNYYATIPPPRKIYLIDPARGDLINGFNPFNGYTGDLSTAVSRRVEAMVKPWGQENTRETPQVHLVLFALLAYAAYSHQSILTIIELLLPASKDLREAVLKKSRDNYEVHAALQRIFELTPAAFNNYIQSTDRRLFPFEQLGPVRRLIARTDATNIDIHQVIEEDAILLVNLGPGTSREAGRFVAALLLNEFREAALARAGTRKSFVLFCDEFHEYITHDIATMLEEVRKGGVSLVLAHQDLAQVKKEDYETLLGAIHGNAQMKAVFGRLGSADALGMAPEVMLSQINRFQEEVEGRIELPTVVGHRMQMVINYARSAMESESSGVSHPGDSSTSFESEGGHGSKSSTHSKPGTSESTTSARTESWSEQHMLVPVLKNMVVHRQAVDYTTKLSLAAEELMTLTKRECYLKFPDEPEGSFFKVPLLRSYNPGAASTEEYARHLLQQTHGLPPAELDTVIQTSRDRFARELMDLGENDDPRAHYDTRHFESDDAREKRAGGSRRERFRQKKQDGSTSSKHKPFSEQS